MRASNCSGLSPTSTSTCASGNSLCKRSVPSCAIRSATSMRIVSATLSCVPPIYIISSLLPGRPRGSPWSPWKCSFLKSKLLQSALHLIQRLHQVYLLEEAHMPHAENLTVQVFLPAAEDHAILCAHLLQQRFRIDIFRCKHRRDRV